MKKPFNLKEALAGAPVVTRDGRKVTEFHKFQATTYPVAAVIGDRIYQFLTNGRFDRHEEEHDLDLFMLSEKKEIWANVYKTGKEYHISVFYDFKHATKEIRDNCVHTVKIYEYEE